jgi:glycosyltransferase involved in cell wall biosynthesis
MKVLFVLENYYPNIGGVETLFKALVERLVAAGHECTVITSRLDPDDPKEEVSPGLSIIRIPVSNRYLFTLQALPAIFRRIRSCDLVQTTSYNAALPAFFAAFWFRRKIVVTFHEAWGRLWFQLPFMGRFSKWAHYLFEQLLLQLPFDRFVAVSKSTAKRLEEEGVAKRRIQVIYNGIDYREFEQIEVESTENQAFTFTYFGRLGISKGLDLLMGAATQLKQKTPTFRLQLIVPKVPADFLNDLKEEVERKQLEDYVYFRHHLSFDDLKVAIVTSDCVVIPSYSEGFCFAAVETVALGTPVISSGQAALPEVVGGQFINMASLSVEGLVEAMEKAFRGEWEEKPPRRFALEQTVEAYIRTYQELLSN